MRGNVSKRKSNTGIGRTDIVKKGTLSNVDIRTVCEAGIYKVENDCTGMPTELNDKSIYFGMTLIVMPWDSKSTDLYYNQYLFVNGYGTDEVNSLFVNQIFSQNGNVLEELKWTKIASSDMQAWFDGFDKNKMDLWDKGVEILNNHKFYTQDSGGEWPDDVIFFYKNADWCESVYIFAPEDVTTKIYLENQDGDIAYSISGRFEKEYVYLIRFGEESKVVAQFPVESISLADVIATINSMAKPELKWQLIYEETLEEDAAFTQTLPDNCKGVRITIHAPADVPIPAMQIYPRSNLTWIYPIYCPGYAANTSKDKLVRIEWKQENGIYTYNVDVKTGTGNYNGTKLYAFPESDEKNPSYQYFVSKYPKLDDIKTGSQLKEGTIIKVWGLIEE